LFLLFHQKSLFFGQGFGLLLDTCSHLPGSGLSRRILRKELSHLRFVSFDVVRQVTDFAADDGHGSCLLGVLMIQAVHGCFQFPRVLLQHGMEFMSMALSNKLLDSAATKVASLLRNFILFLLFG
jgi:hypothetical protein